jgi:hypothetical protein
MTNNNPQDDDLFGELHQLKSNLGSLIHSVWNKEERKKVQNEMEQALEEVSQTLNKAAADFSESDTGKQFRAEVEDLRRRVESGELESQVKADLTSLVKQINQEIVKSGNIKPDSAETSSEPATETGETTSSPEDGK